MRPLLMPDRDAIRIFSLATVILVSLLNVIAFLFFGHESEHFPPGFPIFEITKAIIIFSFLYIFAPAIIVLRVASAPINSVVFAIALLTCGVACYFLYAYFFVCKGHLDSSGQCNIYKFFNIPVFWVGAFLCLFPKK